MGRAAIGEVGASTTEDRTEVAGTVDDAQDFNSAISHAIEDQ